MGESTQNSPCLNTQNKVILHLSFFPAAKAYPKQYCIKKNKKLTDEADDSLEVLKQN